MTNRERLRETEAENSDKDGNIHRTAEELSCVKQQLQVAEQDIRTKEKLLEEQTEQLAVSKQELQGLGLISLLKSCNR